MIFYRQGREPLQLSSKTRIICIVGASLGITLLHYSIGVNPLNHQIYGKLYYAPILMAGLWFGVRGGILTSMVTSLLFLPHIFLDLVKNPINVWGLLLEIPTLVLVGLVTGYLRDRESKVWSKAKKTYAFASHEMKNIGITIHGFVKLINRKGNLSEDGTRFLKVIEKEAQRMERVSRAMLHLSKDITMNKEKIDLNEFLKEVGTISEEMAKERGVHFQHEIRNALPSVWIDPDRMKEALINLTQNAIHATPPGKDVILRSYKNGRDLKIEIIDSGKGISSENLAKIFMPFYTTKPEGTGLGLVITKRIIEAHGATITVDSHEGKGTHFNIFFPAD